MQNKKFIFILALCIGMQFGVSFGMQNPGQSQSWRTRLQNWWRGQNDLPQKQDAVSLSSNVSKAVALGGVSSALMGGGYPGGAIGAGVATLGGIAAGEGATEFLDGIESGNFKSVLNGSLGLVSGMYLMGAGSGGQFVGLDNIGIGLIGLGVVSWTFRKIFEGYTGRDFSKDKAVEKAQVVVEALINDDLVYPTQSTKIHALLKRNEFLVGILEDTDGVIDEACKQLIEKIQSRSLSEIDQLEYERVDKSVSSISATIASLSLKDQVAMVKKMLTPHTKALLSVLLRLERKLLVEGEVPGTMQRTSSAKFYASKDEQHMSIDELNKLLEKKSKEKEGREVSFGE